MRCSTIWRWERWLTDECSASTVVSHPASQRWTRSKHRPQARGATRRCHVRSPLVGPGRHCRLGHVPRGAGYLFGGDIVQQFAHTNDLDLIARAHQLVLEGYKLMFDQTIVTVWSAPNYCYRCGNVASILKLDDALNQKYETFDAAAQEAHGVPAKRACARVLLVVGGGGRKGGNPSCTFTKVRLGRLIVWLYQ